MNKQILILLGMILLMVIGVNAYDPHEQDKDYNLIISSNNATACNLSYIQTAGTITYYNLEMFKNIQEFNITIGASNFTESKEICFGIRCTDGYSIETGNKCLTINLTGERNDVSNIVYVVIWTLGFIGLYTLFIIKNKTPLYRFTGGFLIFANGLAGVFIFDNPLTYVVMLSTLIFMFKELMIFMSNIMGE